MGSFGPGEMLVIAIAALLLFGPRRLPEIARSVGKAVREFKKATADFGEELRLEVDNSSPKRSPRTPAPAAEPDEPRPGPRE